MAQSQYSLTYIKLHKPLGLDQIIIFIFDRYRLCFLMNSKKEYDPPQVNQYGTVEKVTRQNGKNKIGGGDDQFSQNTPLVGSVVPRR